MTWYVYSEGKRLAVADNSRVFVGRDAECEVVVDGPRVSRRHLVVEVDEGGRWTIVDRSSNGAFAEGERLSRLTGDHDQLVALGSPDGPFIAVSRDPMLDFAELLSRQSGRLEASAARREVAPRSDKMALLSGVTRIGRAEDNDIVLPGVLASAHHAHVLRSGHAVEVVDLASTRGTYVNGHRVSRAALVRGDRLTMGGSSFVLSSDGELEPINETDGLPLEAARVTVRVANGLELLHGVSFQLPARQVLAVVGPSGSGKSTLLGALTGFTPATEGSVRVGGRDLYAEYDELRYQIGLVPQADLVPAQLKVHEALDFAARLRFPRDVPREDRSGRVSEVIADLGLTQRAELRIDKLSGGQRKRVSVALEMLTKPALLFLDEPTSGLDPGLDRQVMLLLREMADSGRTVVVVTHAVENLELADKLLVLAAGGYVAYFGPPLEAPAYFGVKDMPSVFMALENAPGAEWTRRWNKFQAGSGSITREGATRVMAVESTTSTVRSVKPSGSWSQFLTLTQRNIRVILSDRTYSLLLLLLPIMLAGAGLLVGNSDGLGPIPGLPLNPEARSLLLVLVLGSVFTGAATSVQELVKDRVIYQRERAVGLSRIAYVGSKAIVLGAIAAVQGFVFAMLSMMGRPGPADPLVLPGYGDVAVIVAIATVTSAMLGLTMSAFLPTRDAALPALVIVTMVQVVFSGAVPLRFDRVLDAVGWVMPGYWEFKGMAESVNLDVLMGTDLGSYTWLHEASQWWLSAGVLALMAFVFVAAAILATGRHDPGSRR